MAEERLTEELLNRLRASARPEAYLDEGVTIDRALSDYLNELRIEKGLKRSAIFRACGINQTQGYDIFGGKSKPGRDRAIMLSLGMGCTPGGRRSGSCAWLASRSSGPRRAATPSSSGA